MPRYVALFIALIGILTVAVAAPFAMVAWNDYKFRQGVDACVADLSARDPAADARLALQSGDDRFFFRGTHGIVAMDVAIGVEVPEPGFPQRATVCEISIEVDRAKVWKEIPFRGFSSEPESPVVSAGPRRTKCGEAVSRYILRFNAEMARLDPRSIQRYCRQE